MAHYSLQTGMTKEIEKVKVLGVVHAGFSREYEDFELLTIYSILIIFKDGTRKVRECDISELNTYYLKYINI